MHLTVTREQLLKPLSAVHSVVARGSDAFSNPILGNFLFEVKPDRLTVTASDLVVELSSSMALNNASAGTITLPGRKLLDIVRELPDATAISITTDKDMAILKSPSGYYKLATLPAKDFPRVTLDDIKRKVRIEAPTLRTLMERSLHAMGKDDARAFLNGLCLEIREGRFYSVGTDGHRLAVASTPIAADTAGMRVVIPRKGAQELFALIQAYDQPIDLELGMRNLSLSLPDTVYITSLIDAKFPDYWEVIPSYSGQDIYVGRQALLEAVQRADIMNENGKRSVAIAVSPNTIKVMSTNAKEENATDAIDAQTSIPELLLGCNAAYLLDALRATPTDDIRLAVRNASTSIVLTPRVGAEDLTQVIMPVRL